MRGVGLVFLAFGILLTFVGGMGTALAAFNLRGNGDEVILIAMIVVLATGVAFLFIARRLMKNRPPVGAVPTPTEGRVGAYLANLPEQRERNGAGYEVQYLLPIPGKHGRQSSLAVRMPVNTPTAMTFNHENAFDRFSKKIGIARECQTGDAAFDAAVYVRCPSEAFAEKYLADADKRAAVLALRKLGFRGVELTGTQAVVQWPQFDPAKHDHPELTEAAADLLALLGRNLPVADPDHTASQYDPRRGWLALLWLFILAYPLTMISLGFAPPLHTGDLLATAAPLFFGGFVLFGWVAAFLLRGTSNAHDRWLPLMIVGLLMHGLGSVGTTAAINGLGDGPLTEHSGFILGKRTMTSGKNKKTTYWATVPSWQPGGGDLEFEVGAGEYGRIQTTRSRMHVVTGPGRLGIEWVRSHWVAP